jgi:hypothetical protein
MQQTEVGPNCGTWNLSWGPLRKGHLGDRVEGKRIKLKWIWKKGCDIVTCKGFLDKPQDCVGLETVTAVISWSSEEHSASIFRVEQSVTSQKTVIFIYWLKRTAHVECESEGDINNPWCDLKAIKIISEVFIRHPWWTLRRGIEEGGRSGNSNRLEEKLMYHLI